MSTDRELLELAAKAAGIDGFFVDAGLNAGSNAFPKVWNPLIDDGDALRLAVKLEIFTGRFYDCIVPACFASWNNRQRSLWEPADEDPYAATRRAIVRAASAIGRDMQ